MEGGARLLERLWVHGLRDTYTRGSHLDVQVVDAVHVEARRGIRAAPVPELCFPEENLSRALHVEQGVKTLIRARSALILQTHLWLTTLGAEQIECA